MQNIDLEQVRKNLSEMQAYLAALDKCQVPGHLVSTIHNLRAHIEDVTKQLQEMLSAHAVKGE